MPSLRPAPLTDLMQAAFELGLARTRLHSSDVPALVAMPAQLAALNRRQGELVERVAYAIPRVAARLPWRADCLVQALAARRWLARKGISTTVKLGVLRDKQVDFEAHAWLMSGDRVITGGDIGGYEPFVRL